MRSGTRRHRWWLASLLVGVVTLSGCGLSQDDGGGGGEGEEEFTPGQTEVVVHTGAGGGSDLFVRQAITIMQEEGIIEGNWPVRNVTEGDGISAMSYLLERAGETDTIAAMTPTWLVTPLTVEGDTVTYDQLQPVAGLVVEPLVVAVRADAPYASITEFVEAARGEPDTLVQVGGSLTASDLLAGQAIQSQTDTIWKSLSFEDTGQRITALLRGDADMMVGAPGDFIEQVRAGELKVISALGDERIPGFDDVETSTEQQLELTALPEQFRGIMAPPELPEAALTYYQDVFAQLVETPGWQEYTEANGLVTNYTDAATFGEFLAEQQSTLEEMVEGLGLTASP